MYRSSRCCWTLILAYSNFGVPERRGNECVLGPGVDEEMKLENERVMRITWKKNPLLAGVLVGHRENYQTGFGVLDCNPDIVQFSFRT
jgi:hypothetical protein